VTTSLVTNDSPVYYTAEAVVDTDHTITGANGRMVMYSGLTAPRMLYLPPSTTMMQTIMIMDEDGSCNLTNYINIVCDGTDKIEGNATRLINYPYGTITIESSGSGDWVVTANPAPSLSAGMQIAPTYMDNGDGSITFTSGLYCFFTNTNGIGKIKRFNIAGQTLTMVDNTNQFIVADYNSGSPIIYSTTDVTVINETTVIPVYTIYRRGTVLHILEWDELGDALGNKTHQSIVKTQRFRVEPGGLGLGEAATRYVTVGGGTVWHGAVKTVLAAVNSSTATMWLAYHVAGVWTFSAITQYNNTQYDDGTDLQTLLGGKYAVNFIYRVVGTNDDNMVVFLGQGAYSLGEAQASQPPANLPAEVLSHGILVGRIIVSQGASTATQIDSAFTTLFTPAGVTDHNSLLNLQGGTASQYYHLTSAEYTGTGTGDFVRMNSPTFTGTVGGITYSMVGALGASQQAVDSAKLGGQLPSYYQTALGFTPINKAGDTGIGNLSMDALTATSASITNATDSTSTTTGAITTPGGIGAGKQITAPYFNAVQTVDQATVPSVYGSQTASTLQTENNTGVDEVLDNVYEAIRFTASGDYNIRSFGVRLKVSATLTNPTAMIYGRIYTDVAGSPGTLISGTSYIRIGSLTTSYAIYQFAVSTALVNGTSYWLIIQGGSAATGGTVSMDRAATGTNRHAYSTNGTDWTLETGKTGWFALYGRTYVGVNGNSTNSTGVNGNSTNNVGVYGNSTNNVGVYGNSTNNVGVYGNSTNSTGVNGNSTNNVGVYGNSTNSVGVNGNSTNSVGVNGNSTNSYGGVFYIAGALASNNASNTVWIRRFPYGAFSVTGDVLKITDNPTVSGTKSGALISGQIEATERLRFDGRVADGASAVAHFLDTDTALSNAGAKLLSLRNAGVEKFFVGADGKASTGALTATTTKTSVYTVATLPAGSDGMRAFVSDATATTFASVVTGGGTNHVPVYYDGGASAWKIG